MPSETPAPEPATDAWIVTIGDRVLRVVGASTDSVRAMIKECLIELIDGAQISVRAMSPAEREAELEVDEGEEHPPPPADGDQ